MYPDARNPFAHPELLADGLEAWTVRELWLMGGPAPSHYVDVTETFERKLAALFSHVSQVGHRDDIADMVRSWAARSAAAAGWPEGRLAEPFQVVPIPY